MTEERPYAGLVSEFISEVMRKIYGEQQRLDQISADANGGLPWCSIEGCIETAVVQIFPDAMVMLPRPPWWFSCQTHYPSPEQPWPLKALGAQFDMDAGKIRWEQA